MAMGPLTDAGVDFANETQAFNFLAEILDDTTLQVISNKYATDFWYGMVAFIGVAAIFNLSWKGILYMRVRAVAAGHDIPITSHDLFLQTVSTLTAVARETSYLQFTPLAVSHFVVLPPFGSILLILAYFGFLAALQFFSSDVPGAQHLQSLGIRASWLAIAQFPLLILLATKMNLIGLFTGTTYERLNVFHRWVARGLLVLATMHFAYQSEGWSIYGLVTLEWDTDLCPPTGIAAYAFILWLNLSTLAPFRNMSYKFFVIQHFVTFVGFVVAMMYHLPPTALYSRVYIWAGIGVYILDRTIRSLVNVWFNTRPATAVLQALSADAVKMHISSSRVKTWGPGAHVRLNFPRFGFWHTHPARILSSPDSHGGDIIVLLKIRGWLTRKLLQDAVTFKAVGLEGSEETSGSSRMVLITGVYPSPHNDFAAYDTLLLVAGGTGVSFTFGVLNDLARRAQAQRLPLRRVEFIWVVAQSKFSNWIKYLDDDLRSVVDRFNKARNISLKVRIFMTGGDQSVQHVQHYTQHEGQVQVAEKDVDKVHIKPKSTSQSVRDSTSTGSYSKSGTPPARQIEYYSERPDLRMLLETGLERAHGEIAVGVCGPLSMVLTLRKAVVMVSDDRAVEKGTGTHGIYLHVANSDYS